MMEALSLRSQKVWAYLQLVRPANVITAWADILVGFAASGTIATTNEIWTTLPATNDLIPLGALGWLLLSTSGLYGGGVVFNDIFDYQLDKIERPERPLPSERASVNEACFLGGLLLLGGVFAAAQVSLVSAGVALAVASLALLYDAWGKHQSWFGPINMGACRGGNWLLGVSIVTASLADRWFLGLVPVTYIAAVTAISRGEVEGGKRQTGYLAIALLLLVFGGIFGLSLLPSYAVLQMLPFALLFMGLVLPAFIKATQDPSPEIVQQAVRSGVLSLIVLDAAIAAGFAGWFYGAMVLILLPLSRAVARVFAVT